MKKYYLLLLTLWLIGCKENDPTPIDEIPDVENPEPIETDVYQLPVVVHVLHNGEAIGEGANLSTERVERQIAILNEDFRRKAGTRGFNEFSFGDDARIEFVLAKQDPNGNPTTGIVRTIADLTTVPEDVPNTEADLMGFFSYWSSEDYINIWSAPYSEDIANIHLGSATGPKTDLPGKNSFLQPLPGGAEGIVINCWHFGESDISGNYNLGRTLTHEMGHYLGLLHPWGVGECETNDYCDDTPAVDEPVSSSTTYLGCDGEEVLIENYMNWSPDAVMNVFTKNQVVRMRYVIENSDKRTSLLTSKGLEEVEEN